MQTKNNLFQKYYPFWNNLSESEKEQFKTYSGTKTFKKGENINRTDECAGFVLIKSGQIRIYIVSEEGREVTLYRLSEGNICIFTAQCVLDSISFDVIVEAEQDTELMILSPGRFHAVSEKNIFVKCFGYELATKRLSDAMWTLQQVLFMRADKRLALLLCEEMRKSRCDEIKLTHEQIAKYMGSAREVSAVCSNISATKKLLNYPAEQSK